MSVLPVGFGSAAGGGAGGGQRSVRFNSADSAYLSRTFTSNGNLASWTISTWLKRCNPSQTLYLIMTEVANGTIGMPNYATGGYSGVYHVIDSNSNISVYGFTNGNAPFIGTGTNARWNFTTNAVFRDPSAWYHVVIAVNLDASPYVRIYVNGVLQTLGTNNTTDVGIFRPFNRTSQHNINAYYRTSASSQADAYLTDYYFIDGQSLDALNFGQFNAQTGVWEPITYVGTYGTNGFYLPFNIDSTALVPGAPTIGTATLSGSNVSVSFTPPANVGGSAITSYTVTSTPGGVTASGATSPITVTGLTPNTSYTFKVKATNSFGTGAESAASNSVTTPAISNITVTYLVVAGGGGGGTDGYSRSATNGRGAGGGGAGGMRPISTNLLTNTSYSVVVGGGGSVASNGNNSVFSSTTSNGGGAGAGVDVNGDGPSGSAGGSGGGANHYTSGGAGISGQGNNGGNSNGNSSPFNGCGGGGKGAVGQNAGNTANAGNGGIGEIWPSGGSTYYAGGGGGGGGSSGASGTGGLGGGGNGARYAPASAGSSNTGGGGGGGFPGANGGSGVVIITIPDIRTATFSGGVTQSSTTSGGFKIYTVTATSTTSETVTFS